MKNNKQTWSLRIQTKQNSRKCTYMYADVQVYLTSTITIFHKRNAKKIKKNF